jgi:hypothetical protein
MTGQGLLTGRFHDLMPVEAEAGRLRIAVDPRLELMAVVQLISDYSAHWPTLTQFDFEYRREVESAFGAHREHAAIRLMNELLARPFSVEAPPFAFSGPVDFALHLEEQGRLHPWVADRALLAQRVGGVAGLHRFAALLDRFQAETGFAAFYTAHIPLYRRWVVETSATAGVDEDLERLERFFGTTKRAYTAVLVPLYGTVGFGPSIGPPGTPEEAVYSVTGPERVSGEHPVFGSHAYFTYLKRHEFAHSFVNPLVDRYWERVVSYDQFARIADAMRARSYGEWRDAVYEHIVRATTTWLAYEDGGAETGDAALAAETARGFFFVAPLLDKIRVYEAQRDRYPTLESTFDELVQAFQ